MKTLNAQGELFEQMLTHFFSSWRNSIERVRWILFPSDPRQREGKYPFYALVHNVAASIALYSHNTDIISAVDVNKFMMERALEHPICNLVLLELWMGAIAKNMRMPEWIGEHSCVDIFLSRFRFAMRLFAVMHKTDYMRISYNLLLCGTVHLLL